MDTGVLSPGVNRSGHEVVSSPPSIDGKNIWSWTSIRSLFLHGVDKENFTFHHLLYLLTPWCRVLLEKLTGLQLLKKFPAFHGTRRFITVLTSVRHLSLSWANPIQSTYPHPTSWRSILISTHLRLGPPSGLFPSGLFTIIRS